MILGESLNKFYLDITQSELKFFNNIPGFNISFKSLFYLDIIAYTKDCTVSHIAKVLGISKPAVTIKVNELMDRGFVKKTLSDEDKRIHYLNLSDDLQKLYDDDDIRFINAGKELEKKYSKEEIELFCKMLTTYSDKLN